MRVKRGFASRRKHKKIIKLASGYRGRKGNCYKLAKRAVQKALTHAYRDRRAKKREFRALWITRINAAARLNGLSYKDFIFGLSKASVDMNRKVLAELAMHDAVAFKSLCDVARSAL